MSSRPNSVQHRNTDFVMPPHSTTLTSDLDVDSQADDIYMCDIWHVHINLVAISPVGQYNGHATGHHPTRSNQLMSTTKSEQAMTNYKQARTTKRFRIASFAVSLS